jgi:hypothetical protein
LRRKLLSSRYLVNISIRGWANILRVRIKIIVKFFVCVRKGDVEVKVIIEKGPNFEKAKKETQRLFARIILRELRRLR